MNVAFKEWAAICKLLREGRQTLILRKGGIVEEGGTFAVEHREFFLFPTLAHEQQRGVKESAKPDLEAVEKNRPPEGVLPIDLYAKVIDDLWIDQEELLKQIDPFHFWSPQTVKMRFDFGSEKGLHALIVRVFQLTSKLELPLLESYRGCKSWVNLEKPIATVDLQPILSDDRFQEQRKSILEILNPVVVR